MPVRTLHALLVAALIAAVALVGAPAQQAVAGGDCVLQPGTAIGNTWPQRRLNFQQVWGITQGAGIRVAVIDSGVNFSGPQLVGIKHTAGVTVIPKFGRTIRDCVGHGTAVTGIIAAQPRSNTTFLGVAPAVTILPIKQTNTEEDHSGTPSGMAAGIDQALAAHAQVINISGVVDKPDPLLIGAVRRAKAAGVVIVAAAGNDGQQTRSKAYPAAYSTTENNVIAVSATDRTDGIADFSSAGGYVTVAAPGKDVPVPTSDGAYADANGTSFATPYVTGTVALMLAADTRHVLTPALVRDRLEATADAPPADVPDPMYGYGIVNPYLAVTAVEGLSTVAPRPARATPLPPLRAAAPADRDLQHTALGLALGLIGLAVLALVAAGILRGRGRRSDDVGPADPPTRAGALVRR